MLASNKRRKSEQGWSSRLDAGWEINNSSRQRNHQVTKWHTRPQTDFWIGIIWLGTGTSSGLLWTRWRTFELHKGREISCPAEPLLASQDGLSVPKSFRLTSTAWSAAVSRRQPTDTSQGSDSSAAARLDAGAQIQQVTNTAWPVWW